MTAAERKQEQRQREKINDVLSISDNHGRLHGERSGEGPRQHGTSEIEEIINARERLKHARPNRPEGAGPEESGFDRNAARAYIRSRLNDELAAQKLEDKIAAIARWAFLFPGWVGRCRICGWKADSSIGEENHVWAAYENGLRLQDALSRELENTESGDPVIADFAKERSGVARRKLAEERHFPAIDRRMRQRKPISVT